MKRIILFILLLISVTASAQLDSSTIRYNDQRGNVWFTVHNVPAWKIDGINYAVRGSDTVARVRANGVFTAEELNILPNGSDMTSQINSYVGLVKNIRLVSDSARAFTINSAANFKGVNVIIENGAYFTGTGSIDSINITANRNTKIADTTLSFTNVKTSDGKFYPAWLGAKGDGVTNDIRFFQRAADIAADNKLRFTVTANSNYINGALWIKDQGTLTSEGKAKILLQGGSIIRLAEGASDVIVDNNDVEIIPGGSDGNLFYMGNLGTWSKNLTFTNNKIQGHGKGNTLVSILQIDGANISHNSIDSSLNKGIRVNSSKDIDISYNRVTNSGRSGIAVEDSCFNVFVHHNFGKGSAQRVALYDGVFDIYGPHNENIIFSYNHAETGDSSLNGQNYHVLFRSGGGTNIKFLFNTAIATSNYLMYAFSFTARDGVDTSGVVECNGNTIILKGRYGVVVDLNSIKYFNFKDNNIVVSPEATPTGSQSLIYSSGVYIDTVTSINATGNTIWMNNKPLRLINAGLPTKDVDFSGTKVYGSNIEFYATPSTNDILNFRWIGGYIESFYTGSIFSVQNNMRSIQVSGLNVKKNNSNLWFLASGYTGTALIRGNIINGAIAKETGGGYYTSFAYNNSAAITVADSVGVLYANRTSGTQTITLPSASVWRQRIITIVGKSGNSNYSLVGTDTIRNGEVLAYQSDGSAWNLITNKPGGGIDISGLTGYVKASGGSLSASGTIPYSDISDVPDVYIKNSTGTGDSLMYMDGDTVKAKRIEVVPGSNVTINKTVSANKINYEVNASGAGGGSYDDTALRDSLLVHRNIIDDLSQNTLNYKFYRGVSGTKADSLYVEFVDTTFRVYAPESGGGSPSYVDGYLLRGTGTGADTATGLFYDKVNRRLGINNSTPSYDLDVNGYIRSDRFYVANGNSYIVQSGGQGMTLIGNQNLYMTISSTPKFKVISTLTTSANPIYAGGINGTPSAWYHAAPATTGLAQIYLEDGVAPTSPSVGAIWRVGNNINLKIGARFYGKLKVDTIPDGTAGTDSILVTSGGEVRRIPGNSYVAASYLSEGEYRADTIWSSPTLQSFTRDTLIYTVIGNKVHVSGRLTFQTKSTGVTYQQLSISLPPSFVSDFPSHKWLSGGGTAVGQSENIALDIRAGTLNASGGALIIFPAVENTTYTINFNFLYKYIPGGD